MGLHRRRIAATSPQQLLRLLPFSHSAISPLTKIEIHYSCKDFLWVIKEGKTLNEFWFAIMLDPPRPGSSQWACLKDCPFENGGGRGEGRFPVCHFPSKNNTGSISVNAKWEWPWEAHYHIPNGGGQTHLCCCMGLFLCPLDVCFHFRPKNQKTIHCEVTKVDWYIIVL